MMHWGFCIHSHFFLPNYPALWETDIPTCHTFGWISQHITKQRICLKSLRDSLYQLPFAGIFFTLLYFLFLFFRILICHEKERIAFASIKPGFGHRIPVVPGWGTASSWAKAVAALPAAWESRVPPWRRPRWKHQRPRSFWPCWRRKSRTLFLWPCGCWCWFWWYCCVIYSIYSSFLAAKMES